MKFFSFGKKKAQKTTGCGCGCGCGSEAVEEVVEETSSCGCGCGSEPVVEPVVEVEEEMAPCACGNMCKVSDIEAEKAKQAAMQGKGVKVLGSGCKKCNELEKATVEALKILSMNDTIDHVKDFAEIAKYGVMSTPALVVDGKVVSMGKVLKTNEVVSILEKARG